MLEYYCKQCSRKMDTVKYPCPDCGCVMIRIEKPVFEIRPDPPAVEYASGHCVLDDGGKIWTFAITTDLPITLSGEMEKV